MLQCPPCDMILVESNILYTAESMNFISSSILASECNKFIVYFWQLKKISTDTTITTNEFSYA